MTEMNAQSQLAVDFKKDLYKAAKEQLLDGLNPENAAITFIQTGIEIYLEMNIPPHVVYMIFSTALAQTAEARGK